MTVPLNADEIFAIAEQIERNADKFYRQAAQMTDDSGLRQKLLDLAAMELRHEKVFAAMRSDLSSREREPTVSDPWGDAALYLRGIADGHVFDLKQDPVSWLTGKETRQDVLRAAIEREKDSIVFYLGIKEVVPQELGKDKIEAILKEEMGHIAVLSDELASSKRT
jgi:rubrerythrin